MLKGKSLGKCYEKTTEEFNCEIIDVLRHEKNNIGIGKYRCINGIMTQK